MVDYCPNCDKLVEVVERPSADHTKDEYECKLCGTVIWDDEWNCDDEDDGEYDEEYEDDDEEDC